MYLGKDIENRDWQCYVRGRVLVHASKTMSRDDYDGCLATCRLIEMTHYAKCDERVLRRDNLAFGAFVGTVEIVDCVKASASPWFFGEYGFVLRNPEPFAKPIPYKGRLGFFDVPESLLAEAA